MRYPPPTREADETQDGVEIWTERIGDREILIARSETLIGVHESIEIKPSAIAGSVSSLKRTLVRAVLDRVA